MYTVFNLMCSQIKCICMLTHLSLASFYRTSANSAEPDQTPQNAGLIMVIAPDKDKKQLGIYPPLFDLIGYFEF